jgi:hypothetical protein
MKIAIIPKYFLSVLAVALSLQGLHAQDFSNLKNTKAFGYSGTIEARSIFYGMSGMPNRRQPFSYLLSGNPTLSIYNFQVPISFSISESDRSFRQPFNQFGMSPTYKWLTLHAGYRNVSFSPYTLGGHTMLGAGFELNPGKLRVGFMYGRLNRATSIDTTSQALVPYSFTRKGYAAKIGYGSANNFFELSYLSAADDDKKPTDLPRELDIITPAKNNVLGYAFKFTAFKFVFLESTGAISLYTNDVNSPLKIDSINNQLLRRADDIFNINATSEYYTAVAAALGFRRKDYGVKISYKRIAPDFKTMGAYFFNSDLENWTVNPNVTLFKNRLRLNGSLGLQHDNLNHQKTAENKRIIASANAAAELTKQLGIDVIYTNFSDNQRPQSARFADSLRIVQTTQTFGVMPRYFIHRPELIHAISGAVNFSSLNDFNQYFSAQAVSRKITTSQYFANYQLSWIKKQLSFFANVNHTALKGQNLAYSFSGFTLGGNSIFFKQKLQAGLSGTFTHANNHPGTNLIINGNGNLAYLVSKSQRFAFSFFLTNNSAKSINLQQINFTETRAELSYQFKF